MARQEGGKRRRKSGKEMLPSDNPENRVLRQLPASVHISEDEHAVHCSIWWGKEQEAGRKIYRLARLFPYPNTVTRGGGAFEKIIFILKTLVGEAAVNDSRCGRQPSDLAQTLKLIESQTASAVFVAMTAEGTIPEWAVVHSTTINFLKAGHAMP